MLSTFHGIELGKKSLMAQQAGLENVGHNLANQSNPNYSRQVTNLSSTDPIYAPSLSKANTAGQIGTGVKVTDISRVRDSFIDDRIHAEMQRLGYWETKEFFMKQVEDIQNEPNTPSLKTSFENFVRSWNTVANNPTTLGSREALVQEGVGITKTINTQFKQLSELRQNADSRLKDKVSEINRIAEEISKLTNEIRQSKALGDNPNDLLDKRDALVENLSKLADISIYRNGVDDFTVYIGGEELVQGNLYRTIGTRENRNGEDKLELYWVNDNNDPYSAKNYEVTVRGGEIKGLMEIRDVDIKNQIRMLDNFTVNLMRTVNDIHKEGYGLNFNTGNNFFIDHPITENPNGVHDFNSTGSPDGTAIYKISGTSKLEPDMQINIEGTINLGTNPITKKDIVINYYRTDTIKDVMDKINQSEANVIAYLDHKNKFTIKASLPDDISKQAFYIEHLEDSGKFLSSLTGVLNNNAIFDSQNPNAFANLSTPVQNISVTPFNHPSGWVSLDESILKSPLNIAASSGKDRNGDGIIDTSNGEGDGSNALRVVAGLTSDNDRNGLDIISKIDTQPPMLDQANRSFSIYLDRITEETGIITRTAVKSVEKEGEILHSLLNKREAYSGVNIDEELTKMITFQHGYQAAARMVSVMDRMLETIINRMGV